MIRLIKFFAILLLILIGGYVAAKFFAAAVPFLAACVLPLMYACIGCAVLLFVFGFVAIIKELRSGKE